MTRWIVEDPRGNTVTETADPETRDRFQRGARYTVLEAATDTIHRADQDEESDDADGDEASSTPSPSTHTGHEDNDDWEPPTTTDGTPCTRCVEQGEPCWQHE